MLIRINNLPLNIDTFGHSYVEMANDVTEVITQPLTVAMNIGGTHILSADMNPINAPQHIVDAFSHVIDWIF